MGGGAGPVSVACIPQSGSGFPVGTSKVTCVATDTQQRAASCSFAVTVRPAPVISATRFVAFGDSITAGVLSTCPRVTSGRLSFLDDLQLLIASVNVPTSYPAKLETLLANRYTTQSLVVTNEGSPGESVQNGVIRLPGVLVQHAPQVLLLQEGVNNVNSGNPAVIPTVVNGLRTMIREARSRNIDVLLGTLLPERAGACRGYAPDLIAPANDQIRTMAAAEGAVLVDLYGAFVGMTDTLLGEDGLHPNEAGYDQMAQTFFDSIRQQLEVARGLSSSRR